MAFHDIRLPDDIEQGAAGGPAFQTSILPMSSGMEQRNIDWQEARHQWDLAYGVQTQSDYAVTRAFFFARRGQAHTFRFKDWSDFELVDELQGVGDGLNSLFQLIKTYETDGPAPYIRRITRPIEATVVFKVNGTTVGATDTGLGQFQLAVTPTAGQVVTVSCEFDMCVRFNVDQFSLQIDQPDSGAIGSLPIIEVRE